MTYEEFTIDSRKELKFRVAKISPVDIMAISALINFEKFETNQALIRFCLENAEVKMGETWMPVKVKGKEVYQPIGIENDFVALNEIFVWMMANVVVATFPKSSESTD